MRTLTDIEKRKITLRKTESSTREYWGEKLHKKQLEINTPKQKITDEMVTQLINRLGESR